MTGVYTRYLTPAVKQQVLDQWRVQLSEPRPPGDLGGKGWPDPKIIPVCERLNQLPGICTLQSCAGHGGGGHLWLWLDERSSRDFNRWGLVLARMSGIEVVSRKYPAWGQEITIIKFDDRFEEACDSVLLFFDALVPRKGTV